MAKSIVFDTGPIISLSLNSLLFILEKLKQAYKGDFIITPEVYNELILRPLKTKKYKLEALRVLPFFDNSTLRLAEKTDELDKLSERLLDLSNSCFRAGRQNIKIVHKGEMEAVAAAILFNAEAIVIDERITRSLIEEPEMLKRHLEKKLHTPIELSKKHFAELSNLIGGLKVIRSFELAAVSYELGFLDWLIPENSVISSLPFLKGIIADNKMALLEAVLWGVKLNGCSVRFDEITELIAMEKKKA